MIDISVADEKTPLIVLINPEIVERKGSVEDEEGCLSIHEYRAKVKRAEEVLVKGSRQKRQNPIEMGRAETFCKGRFGMSRIIFDGLLFIDRLVLIKREFFKI